MGVAISIECVSIILICEVFYIKRKSLDVNEDEGTSFAQYY